MLSQTEMAIVAGLLIFLMCSCGCSVVCSGGSAYYYGKHGSLPLMDDAEKK